MSGGCRAVAKKQELNPKLPTTVPVPKDMSEVNNVHVATLLAEGVAPAAAPTDAPGSGGMAPALNPGGEPEPLD